MYKTTLFPIIKGPTFGDGIDITRYIDQNGLKTIKQTIDSSDFSTSKSIDSIRLKLINFKNRFSLNSNESLFGPSRDGSIVRISFNDKTVFEGVVDESGTYEDERSKTIRFIITSFESLFKKYIVTSVSGTSLVSEALGTILSQPEITPLLSINHIDLGIDSLMDSPSRLEGVNVYTAINQLLLASNSWLRINNDRSISILRRNPRTLESKRLFYGYYDKPRRSPVILEVKSVNTGIQRVFNSIKINDETISDGYSIEKYGLKELPSTTLPFTDDAVRIRAIGKRILSGFIYEKEEIEIKVLSKDVQGLALGDGISLDLNSNVEKLESQNFIPLYGISSDNRYPKEEGKIIPRAITWEIYEKKESPKNLNCILKLRRV